MSSRPGDWNCRSCQHLNFQRRDTCQRCGDQRMSSSRDYFGIMSFGFGSGRGGSSFGSGFSTSTGSSTGPDVRPGDWYCAIANCGAHNFASRSTCFKCGAFKSNSSDDSLERSAFASFGNNTTTGSRSGWKSGDWICARSGCNEHNFASRMECFKCNAPRDSSLY